MRTDFVRPLSTDENVWSQVLDWDTEEGVPSWRGSFQGLWEDLDALEGFLASRPDLSETPYWIVAIGRVRHEKAEAELSASEGYYFETNRTNPPCVQLDWRLLGYDVSDYFQLSGIMNCGLATEADERVAHFAAKLNEFHLFDTAEDALECCDWVDEMVEEHSPFFAYGLYMVRSSAGGRGDGG